MLITALVGCNTGADESNSDFICNTASQNEADPDGLAYGPTCDETIAEHPIIASDTAPEDPQTLCPFVRMLQRAQSLEDNLVEVGDSLYASVSSIVEQAEEFGCNVEGCAPVANAVSAAQPEVPTDEVDLETPAVDLHGLHLANGVSHDCGFTFSLGSNQVENETRSATLAILSSRAQNGQLTFDDLVETKLDMCQRDFDLAQADDTRPVKNELNEDGTNYAISMAGNIEVRLIYTYLGGVDNGYILYTDLERFFHSTMPANKSKYAINPALFAHLATLVD